jgi:hypothetical protein
MSVRCADGILKDDPALALKPPFNEQINDSARKTPPFAGLKFEAKWKVYGTTTSLPPQSQRLLLVMSPRGYQSHAGRIVFDAGETVHQPLQHRQSLRSWLGGSSGEALQMDTAATSIFDSQPLDEGFYKGKERRAVDGEMQAAVEQSIIQAAIDQSKADEQLSRAMQQAQDEEEARQLKIALALSQNEDLELQSVIERSRVSCAVPTHPVVEILSSDDDSDILVVSSRADAVNGSSLYDMGFSEGTAF